MHGHCSELQDLIAALEKRRDQLIDSLLAQQAAGARTDSVYRQIRELQQQLLKELILLRACQKQTSIKTIAKQTPWVFIEKTQTIQYFDVNEYLLPTHKPAFANNSIPLLQGKPTLLRIYMDGSQASAGSTVPSLVTGILHLNTLSGSIVLTSVNSTITTRPLNQINRQKFDDTLNFLLPKEYCRGELSYLLQLMDASNHVVFYSAGDTIRFTSVPDVNVHLVNIRYTEPENIEQDTNKTVEFTDTLSSLAELLQVFPVQQLRITGVETFEWSQQLASPTIWNPLPEMMNILRSVSGSNSIFMGIIHESSGLQGEYSWGNPGAGVCIFKVGEGVSAISNSAHKIGHALGRPHISEGAQSGNFPHDSIGEVGIDLRSFDLKDPSSVKDYMTEGNNKKWTSAYGYQQLLPIIQSGVFSDLVPSTGKCKQQEYYHLSFFRQHLEKKIILFSGFHLLREEPDASFRKPNGINAYIYNYENEIIQLAHAHSSDDKNGDLIIENFDIQFPRVAEMHRILLVEKLQVIAEYFIAEIAPEITITNMYIREKGESHYVDLNWESNAPEYFQPALSYAVRYSPDGERWFPLVAQTPNNYWCVDLSNLPGGNSCRLQVIASAGLRSNIAETNHFSVPVKCRKLYWIHPKPYATYKVGSPIHFAATAYSPDYSNPSEDEIIWTSLKHGFLGTGQSLTVTKLSVGKDWVQVHIPDGCGQLLTQQVEITITEEVNSISR